MGIPKQNEMFKLVLEIMSGADEFSRSDAKKEVCRKLALSREEQEQITSSGVPVYESRVGWAVSWLSDAGYITRKKRGVYSVSNSGKAILERRLNLDDFIRELRKDRNARLQGLEDAVETLSGSAEMGDISPMERLDTTIKEMQEQLAYELMNSIMEIQGRDGDKFFEKIVTDLLEKMGYGKGSVTPASNDGGIDGVIKTDPLGFNPIFIQAKRYAVDHSVGRPEIQSFAGALGSVTRGAFITTSHFSTGAIEFARNYPHSDIVLIDGKKLTELMIQYNLGVSTEREILIKRIDLDYFEQ
ncbi:MAG: restriction endonuclease [Lachnospiraceae bacterium]|nr:restriction endonuclease [Lachnospiraceae bacterium]